jgi:translation initiation factor 3 subunit A
LEESSTPQSILLSTMSTDPEKTQRDSALLLPSLKFLWEMYRAVLDIFKSNSKLEHLYHSAALGALQFCRTYKRRTEFRRLCDMMRMHLGNLQRYGGVNAIPGAGEATDGSAKPNNKVRIRTLLS